MNAETHMQLPLDERVEKSEESHSLARSAKPLARMDFSEADRARFWSKVDKRAAAECWNWTGTDGGQGYGKISIRGHQIRAHRLSLVLHGVSIGEGMVVDHKCRNRACVNPDHLRVVDAKTNVLENSIGRTAVNATVTHCVHGHALTGVNLLIRTRRSNGAKWRECLTCRKVRQTAFIAARIKKREAHNS